MTIPIQRPFFATPQSLTVEAQQRRAGRRIALWAIGLLGVTILQASLMISQMSPLTLVAWWIFVASVFAVIYSPRNAIYVMVAFGLIGDASLTYWYPFRKNFSSPESLFYLGGRMFLFSPFEFVLALAIAVWFLQMAFQRKWEIRFGPLMWPLLLFTGFITFGVIYGFARGGDRTIGLWEVRSMYYLLPLYLLVVNFITRREHLNIILWGIILALLISGVYGTSFVMTSLRWNLSGVESIADHALSIRFNAYLVLFAGSLIYRASFAKRAVLTAGLPFVLIAYIANNRRASFIAMAIVLIVIIVLLYHRKRTIFWLAVPPLTLAGLAYLAAFWNSSGALGAPASAIRSVIGVPSARDASSNNYRVLENINILYTIKTSPLTGVGFGQKFHILVPMADISFFEWWEYITHNSILWIWMKTGIGGFVSLLLMIGSAVAIGTRTLRRMPMDESGLLSLVAVGYIVMHFTFAYVDMSWDVANMLPIGVCMGLVVILPAVAAYQPIHSAKRWPWVPEPQPLPKPLTFLGE